MRTKIDKTFNAAQTRYKQDSNQSVSRLPTICPGDYIYVNRKPTSKTAAERMASQPRSKLLQNAVGPFWITAVTLHKVTITEDSTYSAISIDRGTKNAPSVHQMIQDGQSENAPLTKTPKETRNKMNPTTAHVQLTQKLEIIQIFTSSIILSVASTQEKACVT